MKRHDLLKCKVCGFTLEILNEGNGGVPVCCGGTMTVMPEQTAEFKFEKHVPYPEKLSEQEIQVSVGKETAHPMTDAHYVEWIEVQDGNTVVRKYLAPGETPNAKFAVSLRPGLVIREFCNLHGLWKYEVK